MNKLANWQLIKYVAKKNILLEEMKEIVKI
jgi:hypothetical protein